MLQFLCIKKAFDTLDIKRKGADMKVNKEACTACGACEPYCPLGVIRIEDVAVIDQDECVECGVCFRAGVCPTDALIYEIPPYPRALRAVYSNPLLSKPVTGCAGRGTEEAKTNDVTGRFKKGRVGIGIEPGRPGTGARFRDIEKIIKAMTEIGARFEPNNPISTLIADPQTGALKPEILNEKVMSVVIECDFPIEKLKDAVDALNNVAGEVACAFSVCCVGRAEDDGSVPVEKLLKDLKVPYYINSKTTVGLGRPPAKD